MTKRILLFILFSPFFLLAKVEDWHSDNKYLLDDLRSL